jgi:RNA polymerase sigma-70 factor (ECF subfamily)
MTHLSPFLKKLRPAALYRRRTGEAVTRESVIDPARLTAWFDAHAPGMVLYARQFLGRGDPSAAAGAAEDVVQEVFLRLVTLPSEPQNIKAWLYTAVRNAAIAAARAGARRRRREQGGAERSQRGWFQPSPEDLLDAAAAECALAGLPPGQREVVVLRLWSGMTLAEIAEVTGSSVSGVFALYRTALAAVRRTMGAESSCKSTT